MNCGTLQEGLTFNNGFLLEFGAVIFLNKMSSEIYFCIHLRN